MNRAAVAWALILCGLAPAAAISTLDLSTVTTVNNDGLDIVFGEIADNSDSAIFLKKDSLSNTSDRWSFFLYSLSAGDTKGVVKNGDPDVFYGFTPGPANSVLYARDATISASGNRAIYSGVFTSSDSALIVDKAAYPSYVAANQSYNFAYVKDSNNIYAAGLMTDSPSVSVSGTLIADFQNSEGSVRFPRWSPDAQNIVFMMEATTESTAQIYVLKNVQTLVASGTWVVTLSDSNYIVPITSDTYYNAFPHFVGGDTYILYTRAIPYGNFKFSNFSDTGGCTGLILTKTNWDAFLYERGTGATFSVDTTLTKAAVSSSATHRGYVLLVRDGGDTEGDIDFAALSSTLNASASSAGLYTFPANLTLSLQSGSVPSCVFTVVADTPKSTLKKDSALADVEAVIVPVSFYSSVPIDSTDRLKIEINVMYQDVEIGSLYRELASVGLIHDTSTARWKYAGGSLNTSANRVTIASPLFFSSYAVGVTPNFVIKLRGESCLVQRWTVHPAVLNALRTFRDAMMESAFGRTVVRKFYDL